MSRRWRLRGRLSSLIAASPAAASFQDPTEVRPATRKGAVLVVLWCCLAALASLVPTTANTGAHLASGQHSEAEASAPDGGLRFIYGTLAEIEPESPPWTVSRILVPLEPNVAAWWRRLSTGEIKVSFAHCTHGEPHVHVRVWGDEPFEINGEQVDGVHGALHLPANTFVVTCDIEWIRMDVKPGLTLFGDANSTLALQIRCPLRTVFGEQGLPGSARIFVDSLLMRFLRMSLLVPWPLVLLPLTLAHMMRPMSLCCHLLMGILRQYMQRWRRVWKLQFLFSRAAKMDGSAFNECEPCCICLQEAAETQGENMVVLMPCRHSMHIDCYRSWVSADTYTSRDLICPLCRGPAQGMGTLETPAFTV
eukprot:TRINITY_DN4069_c0_g2_i1.p1 TRINITY_DN4069_c0_g2~~TRINITY_DN4069_c0_g2_i1.p1  ORF type:complete len:364 (-),score=29.01 TRINITY_DN4069_c0_g2_i1:86-1177(-)